jgi:hypothetical protein
MLRRQYELVIQRFVADQPAGTCVYTNVHMIVLQPEAQEFWKGSVGLRLETAETTNSHGAGQFIKSRILAFTADPSVLGRAVKLPFGEYPGAEIADLFTCEFFGQRG